MIDKNSETQEDVDVDVVVVYAWARVINRALDLIPPDKRAAVLSLVAEIEEAERKEQEAILKHLNSSSPSSMEFRIDQTYMRNRATITRLKSLVVQQLARDVANAEIANQVNQEADISTVPWRELFPNGRFIFYEGKDQRGFRRQIKAEFGFDPGPRPKHGFHLSGRTPGRDLRERPV